MPEDHYLSGEIRRTLMEIKHLCTIKKNNFGCICPPLLDISIAKIRVDELHLLLRITGKERRVGYIEYNYRNSNIEHLKSEIVKWAG